MPITICLVLGAAMAGYVVIGLIAELSANSLYTTIFASTLHFFARTFFFVAAAFYAAGLVFLWLVSCMENFQYTCIMFDRKTLDLNKKYSCGVK